MSTGWRAGSAARWRARWRMWRASSSSWWPAGWTVNAQCSSANKERTVNPDPAVDDRPRKIWSPAGPVGRLDVMLVGDTSFGENYQERRASSGRENVLETYGYDHGFERLDGLLEQAHLVVANLETPLTRRRSSPFADVREFLHYSDPDLATKHLLAHGIRAVTLANNHTHDFGEAGLLDTLRALEEGGLIAVGAGLDAHDAYEPLRVRAELTNPLGADSPFGMTLFNAFRAGRHFEDE